VLQELDARIRDLQRLADELTGGKDRLKELDVLSELTKLVPADERAHYRRGVILLGLDRYREAADAFIASLENNSGHEQLFNGAYRGLEQIAAKLPDDVHLLHTLATFSVTHSKDPKSIEKYYKKILASQPQDALAHLRLGYLYYELGDDISAYLHFKRYLELEPASDERETLVEIFGQLRSIVPTKDGFFGENNAV
jgi:tetratricopeptide (TPR) repeat protein